MMTVTGGDTNVSSYFQMRLTAGGDGTGLTIADFDLSYTRSGAATSAKVDATALATAATAHTDNYGIEVDATDCPGLYRFDFPDAAFAAGVREVILTVKHTSCFTESLRVTIDSEVSVTEWNGVKLATTNPLPNAAADAAGGLPVSDAGGLDLDTKLANTNEVTVGRMAALTDWIDGGRLDLLLDAIPTTPMRGTDNAALASAMSTAQADLDTLTGTDGVTLATAQANYAPSKAGDAMTLTAAGILAIWHQLTSGIVTASTIGKLLVDEITSVRMATLTDWINGGRLDLLLDAIKVVTDNLAAGATTMVTGSAAAGTLSTTQMTTNLTEATDDHYNGRIIIWTSGALQNQGTDITGYTGATKLLTFTAVTEAPLAADTFVII